MLQRCARAGGALLVSLAMAGAASAAPNPRDFDQRLTALEQAISAAGAGSGQSQAQLVIQLQQMQAEIRQLRGMVEESANQVEQLQKRQREFYLDLDSRLSALEPGGGSGREAPPPPASDAGAPPADTAPPAGQSQTPEPSVASPGAVERPVAPIAPTEPVAPAANPATPPPVAATPAAPAAGAVDTGGEQAAYRAASDLLRMGRYEDAIAGFQGQLQTYPGGPLADNAQYWIGEAYYVTRQFDRALAEFQRVVSEYPQSPKAADALLKVGYIQYERREFAAARQTLTNLKATWPNSPAARLADNRLSRMKEEGV
jgi:tol-pal system protein YbgF